MELVNDVIISISKPTQHVRPAEEEMFTHRQRAAVGTSLFSTM
jgi:hypothetical protein